MSPFEAPTEIAQLRLESALLRPQMGYHGKKPRPYRLDGNLGRT